MVDLKDSQFKDISRVEVIDPEGRAYARYLKRDERDLPNFTVQAESATAASGLMKDTVVVEVNGDGYFQLPSLPSTLIGQVDQIMPTGYSTSVYWGCLWKSYDRRLFYSGYAASGMTHHFGDYRNSGSGNYANRTPEPVVIG
jgi:hypothetical protein